MRWRFGSAALAARAGCVEFRGDHRRSGRTRTVPSLFANHPHRFVRSRPDLPRRAPDGVRAIVIGGGIAGVSAALLLAERGVAVTLLERQAQLGGRLNSWPRQIADGTTHLVDHGFHGFFRQYYNWRNILRRIDNRLSFLRPVGRYPIVSRRWPEENFTGLPGTPPINLLALLLRSPSLRLRDLRSMDRNAALPLLSYSRKETYREYDTMPASELLDSLGLPDRARAMLFDVFAHSFFNHERDMSAAEMLMQFHFYFLRNPEGLDMDAPDHDYETAIWSPLAAQLRALGAEIRTGAAVDRIAPGWTVTLTGGEQLRADHVVLAADPASARRIAAASDGLAAPLAEQLAAIRTTAPYAVSRIWTDRDVAANRSVFTGVSREATLDSVTLYHRLTRPGGQWARRSGGAILELHAYAADADVPADVLGRRMLDELGALWPEARDLTVLDIDERVSHDAPAFDVGSDATRPGPVTPMPGLYLAGDWVRMPLPTALMERAATSAALAANAVFATYGVAPVPVYSIPPAGLLAGRVPVRGPARPPVGTNRG
ncbi:FAD-dependent oxidoreductase [Dactylosporangium vinaceum]|nr:FAD-dependent oxidoreductase [Dactylosporangium vinaceum]